MTRLILPLLAVWAALCLSGCNTGAPLPKESEQAAQGKATELVWATSVDSAMAQARREGRNVLLDFTSESCGYCKQMERDYYPDPEVIGRMMKAIPVKVSGDEPANQPILSKYGVSAFPVIVFVNGDGIEFGRIEGCPPTKDEFLRALESRLK